MSTAASSFWQEYDRYHDLAERFDRNIRITHPDSLTGRSGTHSCGCSRCARAVTYYTYAGPRP
ncbi:hypothetical protein [Halobellus salinisoli]|uniref:hypothetical protein n=1 Tax=Halobellus salinisoli TaxID=3108500 RepID=UPI0030092D56